MKGFDDFKSFSSYGLKTKLTKKQKIAICSGIAAVVILVIVLCAKGCGAEGGRWAGRTDVAWPMCE